ncbi:alpha/beta hydrolase [Mucilaginibacter sp. Bleaf8]|uniref:alpha/beta hydrolase n=1 Tax=Mucilaginibacter sp. Bleaf8 TaxID=2834430 RepID=UPI001BCB62A3|nr:alpha/beta hydrolase [Mucilaginibacter sp. Bleaf8]MBS7566110.1 alpha/beta hydrolase [Mucilaginibacter sp. Bleaf8]
MSIIKDIKVTIAAMLITGAVSAQKAQPIKLYPNGVPNSIPAPADYVEKSGKGWLTMVSQPTLTPFFPEKGKATGAAIIVIPGGGYAGLAINHEGYDVAQKFADAGVTTFVLKYRLPDDRISPNRTIAPLQDAERAMQLLRERAAEWKIDTHKIGIIGFSAGGHLASTLGTHYAQEEIANKAHISLRPDFMVLLYPVITMDSLTHRGSRENLIGKTPTRELIDLYSNEKQVNVNTPPAFLVHAQDDKAVPVQNSLMFYTALTQAGVKAELHLYPAGGHGFGLNNKTTPDQWFDRCLNWMTANGWLAK